MKGIVSGKWITLMNRSDTYNFRRGMPLVMDENGRLRPATRLERIEQRVTDAWRTATRWWRPRIVVDQVDVEAGCVSVVTERWSWRQMKWVRE